MNSSLPTYDTKRRILVVEDETIIAMDIAMQLRGLGYEPLGPAHSGEQAVALAGELRPDLVLMDVTLAGSIDGIEAALAIRSKYDIDSVFLSAFDGEKNIKRAQSARPKGYLAKPYDEYELGDVLKLALS